MAGDFPRNPNGPVFTVYKKEPGPDLYKRLLEFIRETPRPENFPGLHPGPIAEDEPFTILGNIDVNKARRPAGDLIPCAMCTPNRFLSGKFIFVPALECVTIIGHCCADQVNMEHAVRVFDAKTQKDREESYLLRALPVVPQKILAIGAIKPVTAEATRVHGKFRREAAHIQKYIRDIKKAGGSLTVEEQLPEQEEEDGNRETVGPRGFGRGADRIRVHQIGSLHGMIVALDHYDPTTELAAIKNKLSGCFWSESEEDILYHVADLQDGERQALTGRIRTADQEYSKFTKRLAEFVSFFDAANIRQLHAWGSHALNNLAIEAMIDQPAKMPAGSRRYVIGNRQGRATIIIAPQMWLPFPSWEYLDFG
jgi:hypothetical protein